MAATATKINERQAMFWMASSDTGASSECILLTAMGMRGGRRDCPSDVYDFGRCVRMLRFVDGVRERLPLMRKVGQAWERLIDEWESLTAMYEAEEAKGKGEQWEGECNRRIGEIVWGQSLVGR